MPVRLLAVGDMHLGRTPSRVPPRICDRVGGLHSLGPSQAWRRCVQVAHELNVDGVVLAGDVVEQNDDFYEAYVDLHDGVNRLLDAGIAVFAVAGNHDVEVLPRLANALSGFRLLGSEGQWEQATLRGRDGSCATLLGWSFPQPEVTYSPIATSLPESDPRLAVIGLLHCDRDQSGSRYAPVRSRELDDAPVDAWLLGHIHRPDPLDGPRPMGYLGSLVGLDVGEPFAHGPWLVEVHGRGDVRARQLTIAPIRWQPLLIEADDLEHAGDIHARITLALDGFSERIRLDEHRPRAVVCRITITGRSAAAHALQSELRASDPCENLVYERDGVVYGIERIENRVLPAIELESLAAGSDPAALLARKLLVLRRSADDPQRRALLQCALNVLGAEVRSGTYAVLRVAVPDEEQTAALLTQAGWNALEQLLAQRSTSS